MGLLEELRNVQVCQDRKANVISKPEIMKFWDFEKNTLDPETTRANSEEYAWFKCPKCGYSWQAQIRARQRKDKCPVCETNMVVHKGVNDFRTVYPQLALDTSDEMNPDIDLNSLGAGAHVRIHRKCHVCGFEWDAPVYGRIRRYKGNYKIASCPACSKNQRKDGYDIDYPELVPLYSPNNPIPFQDVRGYNSKLLWICPKHGEYEQDLRSMMRAVKNGNTGCPYCHGSQVHPDESFGVLHPEFVKEWDESNEKTPYDYTEHSSYEAIWSCPDCGTKWKASLHVRAFGYGNALNAMVVRHSRNDIQNLKSFIQRTTTSRLKTESCLIILTDSGPVNTDMNSKILSIIFIREVFDVHIVKVSRCFRDSTILLH